MGCIIRVQFRTRVVIGNYSGTLMCDSLYGDEDLYRSYGKGVVILSVEKFWMYAVKIRYYEKYSDGRVHYDWVVLALVCLLLYIVDPLYSEK